MIIFNYLLMCAIFSTTFLAIKIGVEAGLPPFLSAGLRFLLAGAIIFLWMVLQRKAKPSLLLRKEFLLIGMTSTFLTFATLYWAEQHVSSGIAAILSATGPMMILMIQSVVMRKNARRSDYWGCAVGFAGVCLLIMPEIAMGSDLIWILSCIAILIGEIGYSVGSLATRKLSFDMPDISPITINAVQMMYGGAALLLLSLFSEQVQWNGILTLPALGSVLYLTIVGSMLGHSLYAWLLKATNAFFPSTWLFVSPIIALGLGAFLYGEAISLYSIVGSLLIIGGILIVNLPELRARRIARRVASSA
ncbi:EamA family transporter [Paenibacillus sp. p3-SID867]|uniref:DMT family transporter n=1 Tax=Paenibacillus sp. p3-SID867 TaxID=2916363 RepID=UPI0021A399A2|nr:EamA family transporter [Paenibacillus sp. p3-SID867]MCT1403986.1 EamA family transporter [Paenibacillus sp. p3-SID867]